jgi:transposase
MKIQPTIDPRYEGRLTARGFRNFTNYRLRCLLAAGGHRPYRIQPTNHA